MGQKNNKPCDQNNQGQKNRNKQGGGDSTTGNTGNTNNGGQAGT